MRPAAPAGDAKTFGTPARRWALIVRLSAFRIERGEDSVICFEDVENPIVKNWRWNVRRVAVERPRRWMAIP